MAVSVSGVLLMVIYIRLDITRVLGVLADCRLDVLSAGLALIAVTTTLSSWRLSLLAPDEVDLGLAEAIRLNLAASVLNLVLPSKIGDIVKAGFIRDCEGSRTVLAIPVVVFEKSLDVLALLMWCCLGLVALPRDHALSWVFSVSSASVLILGVLILASEKAAAGVFGVCERLVPGTAAKAAVGRLAEAWVKIQTAFWSDRRRLVVVVVVSLLIWLVHLVQIWLFIVALGGSVPFAPSMGLTALSIFAGLVLPTVAGIGSRDLALIVFFRDYLSPEVSAALGILCTTRYVLPALAGLPFIGRYASQMTTNRQ